MVIIGFNQFEYSVLEGGILRVNLNVTFGIVLGRDVVVMVESVDGTATGI